MLSKDELAAVWQAAEDQGDTFGNGKTHVVPLSDTVIEILTALPRFNSPYVFPARGKLEQPYSGYSKGKRMLNEALGIDDWTLHDLRRPAWRSLALSRMSSSAS